MSAAAAAANSKTAEAPAASAAATATFDPELAKLLGDNFVGQNDAKVTGDAFKGKGKTFGIYFSAHWCPPCRMFTPELVKTYNKLKTATDTKDKFEIIFSSWDRDAKAFGQYFGSMPWIAIPFADKARNQALGAHFKVEGIPTLVVIDGETGAVITKNGRGAVDADPEGKAFPWTPQPAAELTPATVQDINETAVLIGFFHNSTDAVGAAGKAAITKLAEEVYADAKAKKAEPELNFWYGLKHAVVPKVAGFLRVPDDGSVGAVLVDIPNGVKYTVNKPAADITYDVLKSFYADLRANKLKPEMLQ